MFFFNENYGEKFHFTRLSQFMIGRKFPVGGRLIYESRYSGDIEIGKIEANMTIEEVDVVLAMALADGRLNRVFMTDKEVGYDKLDKTEDNVKWWYGTNFFPCGCGREVFPFDGNRKFKDKWLDMRNFVLLPEK